MSRITLEGKLAGETELVVFDFTSKMVVGTTISTKTTTCSVYSGTDSSPSSVINGAATSSGQKVTQSVTGGVLGVVYLLVCTITTSDSQTLILSAFLCIVPNQE